MKPFASYRGHPMTAPQFCDFCDHSHRFEGMESADYCEAWPMDFRLHTYRPAHFVLVALSSRTFGRFPTIYRMISSKRSKVCTRRHVPGTHQVPTGKSREVCLQPASEVENGALRFPRVILRFFVNSVTQTALFYFFNYIAFKAPKLTQYS
jgi:hypothetical protein